MRIPPKDSSSQPAFNKANPPRAHDATKTAAANDETFAAATHAGETAERSFASVLDDTARPATRKEDDNADDSKIGDRHDPVETPRAAREKEARRRDDRRDDSADERRGGFERTVNNTTAVREPAQAEVAPGARAILHIADLERIVAQVRTQTLADRREVVISLNQSVLEGLQVKLSADKGGRVSAEFIAASESVRAQLDQRANDLTVLLRSRGVDLADLRTSVGTNDTGDGGQDSSRRNFSGVETGSTASGRAGTAEAVPGDDLTTPANADLTDTSYHA